jgi:CheY-like chemotaxis protein
MKKLLIADDEMDIVESIKEMLTPYYQVDTATAGFEVLQLCERERYEGLIIDVDFGPGISGLEVASILRTDNKDIKILIFSAIDYSDAVRQQVVDIGAVFCEKPLSLSFIRKILEDIER